MDTPTERRTACFGRWGTPPGETSLSARCALREEQSVSELALRYDMSFAAVQKHVAVLERAGLIIKRARGRERVVNADLAVIQRASQLLRAYEGLGHERLGRRLECRSSTHHYGLQW